MSRTELQAWALNRYCYQAVIPRKDATIIARAEDPAFRDHLSTVETERAQIERVRALRASRDNAAVERTLDRLRSDARDGTNTLPAVIDAIRNYATVGEVCGALSEVWGRYRMSTRL